MINENKETGRIEAFSDGVFAVAITLLILDIRVPPIPAGGSHFSLGRALLQQWPSYAAFVTSFLTILIMWINHHRVFGLIRRSDDRFLLINGVLLLSVCVVPFSTSLLAAYVRHRDARIAMLVYAGTNLLMALSFHQLWRYAALDGRLLARDHDTHIAAGITKSYRYGPLLYLTVFALASVHVIASAGLCVLLAIYFTISPRNHVSRSQTR